MSLLLLRRRHDDAGRSLMTHWREKALCRGLSELFETRGSAAQAAHLCRHHCPVLDDCRRWSRKTHLQEICAAGVWWTGSGTPSGHGLVASVIRAHNVFCRALAQRAAVEEEG